MSGAKPVRVLIVDDSATVRSLFTKILQADPRIEVVGAAPDPYVARDMVVQHAPDVLTLDLEMPRMDGITFLTKLMRSYPLPVVIVSSLTQANSELAVQAMGAGAVEVLCKGSSAHKFESVGEELVRAVKAAAGSRVERLAKPAETQGARLSSIGATTNQIVAIGCSTGGTQALEVVLTALPADAPGMVVAQHMPEHFTRSFAERLDGICAVEVKEADDGESITAGRVLIAPGNRHLEVAHSGARLLAKVTDGPRVNRHRPSVDVLFRSVAETTGRNSVGVIMTGMGADGAIGLKEMRDAGAWTIGQDEATCVVYGMPERAYSMGAVQEVLPLSEIAQGLLRAATSARPAA